MRAHTSQLFKCTPERVAPVASHADARSRRRIISNMLFYITSTENKFLPLVVIFEQLLLSLSLSFFSSTVFPFPKIGKKIKNNDIKIEFAKLQILSMRELLTTCHLQELQFTFFIYMTYIYF